MIKIHLSRLLGDRKLTQADLARITGIRPNTINDMYHDVTDRVSLDALDRICEALGCELMELLERVPCDIRRTGGDLILEPHLRRKLNKSE